MIARLIYRRPGALAQPCLKPLGGKRPGKVISLRGIAPHLRQYPERAFILHTFRRYAESQFVAQLDRGAHDRRVAAIVHANYERFVDLDRIHRQLR